MIDKNDITFDICLDGDDGWSYTYYGKNINGIATVSLEAHTDIYENAGVDMNRYIMSCFMLYDDDFTNLKNHNTVYKLYIEFTNPGLITPIFNAIKGS